MSRPSAARNAAPSAPGPRAIERDTLPDSDSDESEDFLRDQLEALLASPTLARVADRHSEGRDDPAAFDEASSRDTVPSIETQLLREALRSGVKP